MKFSIEIEDFWYDQEEGNLSDELKSFIINEIVRKLSKQIDDKTIQTIELKATKAITDGFGAKVSAAVSRFFKSGRIKPYRNSVNNEVGADGCISIEQYIQEKFTHDTGWSSGQERIEKLAKKFADEMRNRYDLLFASQLVIKLNEQGLLKEDVARAILKDTKN